MKKSNQIALFVGAGIIAMTLSIGNAVAQDKPKGKPWKVDGAAEKVKSTVKADEATLKEGKNLYATHCKSCHGVKGKGDGPKAAKIDISCGDFSKDTKTESDGTLFTKATDGRKPMPSFKEKLSDTERWQVIAFLRTLEEK